MGLHFTYKDPDRSSLKQGDILKKTPELLELINMVHPHYANDDYLYFQVLTQSCDLVRRNGDNCKTRYITLAAVRSLDLVISRVLEKFNEKIDFEGKLFCSDMHKRMLEDFVNKLLNNNDTNHFFLQAATEHELDRDCCTQLHLSISIRAYEHYDVCLNSKILELQENFRAKLGWLVGNLYSRVGTDDYVPSAIPDQEQYKDYVNNLLDGYVAWLPSADFSQFKKQATKYDNLEQVQKALVDAKLRVTDSQLSSIVAAIAKPMQMNDDQKIALRNILAQQPLIKRVLG
jgi:hypothetical protein